MSKLSTIIYRNRMDMLFVWHLVHFLCAVQVKKKRHLWCKLHFAVDVSTHEIIAADNGGKKQYETQSDENVGQPDAPETIYY
ncbi:hypothetical protein [Candidatus Enterovibrio escicola]|nr:hypothetical protein [Candidatus Enterovibrio escacola]